MRVRRLDHIVLTVSDIAAAERFYHEVFDMPIIADQSDDHVTTLRCGHQLIRLQRADCDALKATHPTVGPTLQLLLVIIWKMCTTIW